MTTIDVIFYCIFELAKQNFIGRHTLDDEKLHHRDFLLAFYVKTGKKIAMM